MEPILICADSIEADNGRVYYVSDDNKRHWIQSPEVASSYGWDLSNIIKIPMDEVLSHPLSASVAKCFDNTRLARSLPLNRGGVYGIDRVEVWSRGWFGSQFKGRGLEFGAASMPWPCSLDCRVEYADSFSDTEGCKVGYESKDFVPLNFTASLEDMREITKTDYNFIVCSHVIEHTPRVIQAIKNIYEHLAVGGVFVMAVPHKEYTFDQFRQLTPVSHHIKDYEQYERSHDVIHLIDFLENAHIKYQGYTADITSSCREFLSGNNIDMHYHTFTENSFAEIIDWFNTNVYKWSSCEIFDRLEGGNEFFVRLVK